MAIVSLRSVAFDHDPTGLSTDALSIRKDHATPVTVPEWRKGISVAHADSRAAYAIRETRGKTLTVKAAFVTPHPEDVSALWIRAIDPQPGASLPKWLFWLLVLILALLRLPLPFNVLGRARERLVTFKPDGTTDPVAFRLDNVLIWGIAFPGLKRGVVGKFDVTWRWQYRKGLYGHWQDFEHSRHRIYTVLQTPRGPWTQGPGSPTQWPWADALDLACGWAVGADSPDAAAAAVTRAINGHPLQTYTPATMFGWGNYMLSSYIAALNGGAPYMLNCTDCADAVTTFSNLLGCNLWEGRFETMTTRRFLPLNGNPSVDADWVSWTWSYHEICFLDQLDTASFVYDGCLQLDMHDDYTDTAHMARLPIRMRFGATGSNDYRFRLVESGPAALAPPARRRAVM